MGSLKSLWKIDIEPIWLMRIFTIIPVVLILLAGTASIWMYFFVLSLLPEGQSLVDMPGLEADVRVVRDRHGVPGIIGESEGDVALVLGYVMAQDRLWQMDFLRKASQGRLAEILGPNYLDHDHLMRTVCADPRTRGALTQLGEKERQWLDRFVQGINWYVSSHAGKLPIEFSFLEYHPKPFTSGQVLDMLRAVAWESSPAARIDPVMTRILGRLGKTKGLMLFPSDPSASTPFVSSALSGWQPEGLLFGDPVYQDGLLQVPGFLGGSAWAVAGEKSQSGKPMACWNVYQSLAAPRFWYRARLVAGDFHLAGAFVPGVPVAFVGNNRQLCWGALSTPADDADLFVEILDADSPTRYWRIDRWLPVHVRVENYRVRGSPTISRSVISTRNGPLVSNGWKNKALSLRWTASGGTGLFGALFTLNRTQSGSNVPAALQTLVAPSLNVLWADNEDNYGLQFAGRVPIRASGSDGIVPMPGWTGVHDWQGFIPFDELPSQVNPIDGFAVLAGDRPGGARYPFFLSCYWDNPSSSTRIRELLNQEPEHHRRSFERMQMDTFSPMARILTPILLKSLANSKKVNRAERKVLSILGSWDYRMDRESAGPAAFGLVYQALVNEIFRKALGTRLYDRFTENKSLVSRLMIGIFRDGGTQWLGDRKPADLLKSSFRSAVDRGKSLMGDDPEKWNWGMLHAAVFRHPLTVRSRFLEILYQVGPIPMSGGPDTVNFASWSSTHPFRVDAGVSLRQTAELSDPPSVFAVSPMGSSAHFFSSHYKDQMGDWLDGRTFRDPVQRAEIRNRGFNAVLFKSRSAQKVSRK